MSKLIKNRSVIAVHDLELTIDYYQDKLGFKVKTLGETGWAFAERNNFFIMIGECPSAISPEALLCHNYFAYVEVIEITDLHREYRQKGVEFKQELEVKPWGMKEFEIVTIDGHRIMFGQEFEI